MTKTAPKTWLLWGRKTNTAGGQRIKITDTIISMR